MKYFSCQPDSHNAFGSLTNGVLTYFTVDCARYKRVTTINGRGGANSVSNTATAGQGKESSSPLSGPLFSSSSPTPAELKCRRYPAKRPNTSDGARSFSPPPPLSSELHTSSNAFYSAYHESQGSTDTRMHVQRTLTLPSAFQATQCCFSMANRTVFGTDMVFIGAANGLLALVVLGENLVLYVQGRDPQTLREALHRGQRLLSHDSRSSSATATTTTVAAAAPLARSSSTAISGGSTTGAPAGASIRPSPALSVSAGALHHQYAAQQGAPSTITWMRDKPLVLVGYTTGVVEWYEVSISAAHQQALREPAAEQPFGAAVSPGVFAFHALNRECNGSRAAKVVAGGEMDGLRAALVARCELSDAGALISSDYFPANGTVAVSAERGRLYLFHTDQLDRPLCELQLSTPTAGLLYCHPFLPLVGIVSAAMGSEVDDGRRRAGSLITEENPRSRNAHSSLLRGGRESTTSSPANSIGERPYNGATGGRSGRHVGWHDEGTKGDAVHSMSGPLSASQGPLRDARCSGCVLAVVAYAKAPPPRHLARSWSGPEPLGETHRLTQVLRHWLDSAAPRYGTFYNFSWKFSFDLELVVGNLEEGTLRIVRMVRTVAAIPSPSGGATFPHPAALPAQAGGRRDGDSTATSPTSAGAGPRDGAGNEEAPASTHLRGANGTTSTTTTIPSAVGPEVYRVVHEYSVRLPLHSLVNVEYVSAATSSLSTETDSRSAAAAVAGGAGAAGGTATDGNGSVEMDMATFHREAERHRRSVAVLAAAAEVATDPRTRLGFSAATSTSGALCRPASAFWAGLAVVSPAHTQLWQRRGGRLRDVDPQGLGDLYERAEASHNAGGEGGGPQLKENVLAAAMLQPLRGEDRNHPKGDLSHGSNSRHRRRGRDTETSGGCSSSSARGLTTAASSSVTSTQQTLMANPTIGGGKRQRGGRATRGPAVPVPSYAATSTQNEMANAVLIAADSYVNVHRRLRIGPGNVSCVVGMNAAGEVASVPIEVRAVATWHEEGSIFVGLGPTTCAADLVSIQGIERVMRRRHAAGFGIAATANLQATRKVGGYGSDDVALFFLYVATLERVSVVSTVGPVPSMMELLSDSTTSRDRRNMNELLHASPELAPRLRLALHGCAIQHHLNCLLVLQVLGWLPPSLAEDWASAKDAMASAAAVSEDFPAFLKLPFEDAPVLTESHTNSEIERAAAVEATHGRLEAAAHLFLRFADRSANYGAIAALLRRPIAAATMVKESDARVCAAFCAALTPWLRVVFHCVCRAGRGEEEVTAEEEAVAEEEQRVGGPTSHHGATTSPLITELPLSVYADAELPLWDRVALAVSMERGRPSSMRRVLMAVLLPSCNPLQALLLAGGIHRRTSAAMQEIVDITGDFQLAACLYARVGVMTRAALSAFPFLLDAVAKGVSAAAAAAARAAGSAATLEGRGGRSPMVQSPSPSRRSNSGRQVSLARADRAEMRDGNEDLEEDGEGEEDATEERRAADASPFAYLYGGRGASPANHMAHLVQQSALPPVSPSYVVATVHEGRPGFAAAPTDAADRRRRHVRSPVLNSAESVLLHRDAGVEDDSGDESEVEVEEPWVWWAAAYRSFLDDEQAFVRRTTFDVECQQLRERAYTQPRARRSSTLRRGSSSSSGSVSGNIGVGGRSLAAARRFRSPSAWELEALAGLNSGPNVENRVTLPASSSAALRGGWPRGVRDTSSPTTTTLSVANPRYGRASPYGPTSLVATAAPATPMVEAAAQPAVMCVCGERHEGTQLLRSLLNRCSTTTTRCSVCAGPVQLGSCDVAAAFAWCTACRHGGHAHHLQRWFRTHRRCPVAGCDCRCDEDSSLF